jgi:enamine deaminase RidA (YjgF/YER057c/UK114 family)
MGAVAAFPNARTKDIYTGQGVDDMTVKKATFGSGTVWEDMAGYSRAVRVGDRILVSGTTATGPDGLVGGADPAAQARFIFDKIEFSIKALGGRFEDIVHVLTERHRPGSWCARAWRALWAHRPVNTLVEAKSGAWYLVGLRPAVVSAGGLQQRCASACASTTTCRLPTIALYRCRRVGFDRLAQQ